MTLPMETLHKKSDHEVTHSANNKNSGTLEIDFHTPTHPLDNNLKKYTNDNDEISSTNTRKNKILGEVEMTEAFRKSQDALLSITKESRYCIIELPVHVKAGDRLRFVWPSDNDDGSMVSSPNKKSFGIIVPACFPTPGIVRRDPRTGEQKTEKRRLRIVAPDGDDPEITNNMRTHFQITERQRKRQLAQASHSRNVSRRSPPTSTRNALSTTESAMNIQWREYKKSSSRIGKNFQATFIPKVGTWKDECNDEIKQKHDSETIWNPQKAKWAIYHGQDVTKFLESLPTNRKFLGLEALHKQNYHVGDASDILEKHIKLIGPEVQGDKLSPEKAIDFERSVRTNQKNFSKISEELSISMATALVHYYTYFKPSPIYQKMRLMFKSELDECQICGEGGKLLCCDRCASPYHLACVYLEAVPDDEWFCPKCTRKYRVASRNSL